MSSKLNLVVWFGLGFGLINLLVFISFIIVPTEAPPTDVVAEHKEGAKQLTLVRELASTGSEEPKIVVEERAGSLSDRLAAIKKKQITALNELESSSDPRTLSNSSGASGRLEKMFETQRKEETEQVCYKIGPLYKTNDVSRLKSGLREVGIKGKEEVVNPKDFEGYWVYLAPSKTYSLARLKVEELKLKGVKDVAIVGKVKPRNAISLGLFKNKNIAQEKFEQVRGLGYEPKMMERFKDRRKTYLSIQVEQNRFVNKERWTQILSKYTSGKIESAECEDAPASSRFANIQQAAE